jgi:hypothetical protein
MTQSGHSPPDIVAAQDPLSPSRMLGCYRQPEGIYEAA